MQKHFVDFYSPGSFVSEVTREEVETWDIEQAIIRSKTVGKRYGATPYGFRFITKSRKENELDSSISNTSNMYYLGGEVLTLEEVKAKNDPNDEILIGNMERNGYNKIIINRNSWKFTAPLLENDIVLPYEKTQKEK